MNRLLHIGGIILLAAAILAAIVSFTAPGQVVLGVNLGLAAVLLVGGFIVLGLAGALSLLEEVIETARRSTAQSGAVAPWLVPGAAQTGEASAEPSHESELDYDQLTEPREPFVSTDRPVEGESPVDMEVAEERLQVEAEIGPVASVSEPEDVEAAGEQPLAGEADAEERLTAESAAGEYARATERDQAREDAEAAETPEPALETAEAEHEARDVQEEFAEEEPAQLYVVEERRFRGKPARLLSDGTVEAETDEGWLRFEDFEHLQEYLDAMAAQRRHP